MSGFEERKYNINLGRDIKSSYNLEEIFSFLDKRLKMNIIIYNTQLQKILGFNMQDYKETSGKYKEGKKDGKGKEYKLNTHILIFEGEYLNGKKIKGKEYYDNGNLRFEGEYLNGKRIREGKEFYDNEKLKFEGEYLNGQRNGKGKEYYNNGELKFEGEYLNDQRNGKGKEYNNYYELKFEGEYLNGKKNGKGKEYYDGGNLKFEGEYLYGQRNGKGKEYYYYGELKFEGEYFNGIKWNGKYYNKSGISDSQIKDGTKRRKK